MDLFIHQQIKHYFSETQPLFEQLMTLRGVCFRQQKGRLTQRIQIGQQHYFIKQHTGVGIREIVKNLVQCRWPVVGAKNEWRAIEKLQTLNVSVPPLFAYGQRGWNPACKQSFVLMAELTPTISLEDLCKTWQKQPPTFRFKQRLIAEVARMTRILHQNGMNHRDLYICHFLLDISHGMENLENKPIKLALIDLHRAQIRRKTPMRWMIKDLACLLFSCKGIGLTKRDLYRFMKSYTDQSLRDCFHFNKHFWLKVSKRGSNYRDHTL